MHKRYTKIAYKLYEKRTNDMVPSCVNFCTLKLRTLWIFSFFHYFPVLWAWPVVDRRSRVQHFLKLPNPNYAITIRILGVSWDLRRNIEWMSVWENAGMANNVEKYNLKKFNGQMECLNCSADNSYGLKSVWTQDWSLDSRLRAQVP